MVPSTTNTESSLSIWNNGFGGVNMSSEPPTEFDLLQHLIIESK